MVAPSLVVIKRNGADGQRYVIDDRQWCTIGSHPECDIIIHSRGVAKLHALVRLQDGAQVFGLDESLPTVVPAKKASLLRDEGARLEEGDIFIVGERQFRFEAQPPLRGGSWTTDTLTDKTNTCSSRGGDGNLQSPALAAEPAHSLRTSRRSSLVVKDSREEFRPAAQTQTLLTARRMSLPASAVVDEFFANMVSPGRRGSLAHQRRRSPSPCAKRSPVLPSSLKRLTDTSPRANAAPASAAVDARWRSRASDAKVGGARATPRLASCSLTEDELQRRQTPRRAAPQRETDGSRSRIATPGRVATPKRGDPASATGSRLRSPRRLQTPQQSAVPFKQRADEALDIHWTPKRAARAPGQRAADERDEVAINKRVAAESPLFTPQPKRARTCVKAARTEPRRRAVLALSAPRRVAPRILRALPSPTHEHAVRAAQSVVPAAPRGAGGPQFEARLDADPSTPRHLPAQRSTRPEAERRAPMRQATPRTSRGQVPLPAVKARDSSDGAGLFDAAAGEKVSGGGDVRRVEGAKVTPATLRLVQNTGAGPDELPQHSPPHGGPSRTPRGSAPPRKPPSPSPSGGGSHHLHSQSTAGRLSVPRKSKPARLLQPTDCSAGRRCDGDGAAQVLHAGASPAMGAVPRMRGVPPAAESRLPVLRHRPVTPEKQMRPSPEAKRCLSQKPRSAISKSARKRRRESSTVQRTVLFADTAGEDIELASGPHYSPVPKPRGSPRRSGVAAFDDDVVGVSDGDAAMPPTFVNALPRPSPGTGAGPVERDVVPAPADSCSRALGPPPSTPLGRLGWFFYPTRPAVPLLTDGSPSRPDVANDSDAGAVLEPSLADESSGSSDGAAAPILLPFTESGAPAESHSPPRRRSLLGGLASLGSYAAGSVLRRFSGAQPRVSLDGTDTADDSGDLEGAADAHSSADAVRGAASDPACAAEWTGGENSAGAAEAEDKGDSVEGSRYPLDKTVPGKNEAVDPCDNTDEEDEEEADGRFAVEARGGRPGHLEPEAEDVDVKSPPRPRRQSFLGRAYSAVFSGSGRRQDECLVQVHEPAPQGSSPAPVECENDPAVVGEHAAREVNSDGGGEVCDRTGHSDRSSSSASQETDFTSWTVKELREYLSGLGRACNGMRKAALVGLATELSRSDAADVPTHAAERNSLSPAIRTGGDSGEGTHGLSGHTVLELRKILADLGMETTGRKAELVRRLEAPLSGLVGKDGRAFADNEDGNERAEVGDGEAEALAASSSGKASASYSALPVRGLRELLEQRGLSATGRKQVLIDRLSADDMASDAAAPEPTVDDTGAVGLDALTVAGLRVQLGALGLSTAGKKGELKTRLAEALARDRGAVVLVDGDAAAKALVWKTADPSRMTVVQLRNALLENAMCGFGNKARLVQKVNALRAGERAASRLRGRDDLTICPACEKGEACKASV